MPAITENESALAQPFLRSRLSRLNNWQRIGLLFTVLWLGVFSCQARVSHDAWKRQVIGAQIANHYHELEKVETAEAFLDAYSPENDTDHLTRKELSAEATQLGILSTSGRFAAKEMRTASLAQWGRSMASALTEIGGGWIAAYAFVWIARRRGDHFRSLNGWERIGITLSGAYMVIAAGWLLLHHGHSGERAWQASQACSETTYAQIDWCNQHPQERKYAPCGTENNDRLTFCNHQLAVDLERFRTSDLSGFYEALPYLTIAPVSALWLLAYSIVFLIRWVVRGFSSRSLRSETRCKTTQV